MYKTTDGVESLANFATFGYTDDSWGDLLTNYKGTTSYYDAMGNPTAFSDYKFTWKNGRELATVIDRNNNVQTASYEYNSSGMRISKTTSDGTAYYAYDESNNLIFEKHNDYSMVFHYDGNGVRTHFDYKSAAIDASFYYRYNAQGDVIALLDSTGAIIAEYDYTAYGRQIKRSGMISSAVGDRNPFRYRGYYYDDETGLYYLQSRYYDAYVGRFISADKVMGVNNDMATYNLFAYCGNNPITFIDRTGESAAVAIGTTIKSLWPILKKVVVVIIKGVTAALVGEMITEGSSALKIEDEAKPDLKINQNPNRNSLPNTATDILPIPSPSNKKEGRYGWYYLAECTYPGAKVYLNTEMTITEAQVLIENGKNVWTPEGKHAAYLIMSVSCEGFDDGTKEKKVLSGENAYHYHFVDKKLNGVRNNAHVFFGYQAIEFV